MRMNLIRRIAKKYHLKLLILFGSSVRGGTHLKSDIDLAFYPSKPVDEEKLYEEFVQALAREDIDLVNLATTQDHLVRFEILHTGKVLYEIEKGIKSRMEWQSYFDYVDFKKYYDWRSELIGAKLAQVSA
jgi:predicted nucleotidyltransferase